MIKRNEKIVATPPGETIKELLESREMTEEQLMHFFPEDKHENVRALLEGTESLTIEFASRLRRIFGVPTRFWLQLEQNYREKLALLESDRSDKT